MLEKAGEAYRKHLKDAPRAIDYCKGRGLSGDIARRFGLGYAPQGWRSLASVFPNYDDPLLVESGLVILNQDDDGGDEKRYDRFRDRLMFPIRNVKGECIGFGGRVLGDDKPKYLNSPETPVFSKGRELYGLFEARTALREQGFVLVTEGYMDVVALAQLGFPNAVATLGTACTPEHVQKLFRFTDAVVFSFDGDAAGRRAARKALEGALPYATDVRNVKFLFLPPEHDPDSFIRANGQEAFAQCIQRRGAAEPLPDRRGARRLRPADGRRPLPDGQQCAAAVEPVARRRAQAPVAGRNRSAGAIAGAGTDRAVGPAASRRRPGVTAARTRRRPTADSGRCAGAAAAGSRPHLPGARRAGRMPASRADHAARILLGHMAAWDLFSAEDHALLCQLPQPHGAAVRLARARAARTRRAALGRDPRRPARACCRGTGPARDGRPAAGHRRRPAATRSQELRNLLQRMLVEHLKAQETQADRRPRRPTRTPCSATANCMARRLCSGVGEPHPALTPAGFCRPGGLRDSGIKLV